LIVEDLSLDSIGFSRLSITGGHLPVQPWNIVCNEIIWERIAWFLVVVFSAWSNEMGKWLERCRGKMKTVIIQYFDGWIWQICATSVPWLPAWLMPSGHGWLVDIFYPYQFLCFCVRSSFEGRVCNNILRTLFTRRHTCSQGDGVRFCFLLTIGLHKFPVGPTMPVSKLIIYPLIRDNSWGCGKGNQWVYILVRIGYIRPKRLCHTTEGQAITKGRSVLA
jgi:hypothetical protein